MKKTILTIAATLLVAITFGQTSANIANYDQLPKNAKTLLSTHFNNDKVVFVEIDRDLASIEYEVKLQSGAEINFNSKGEWIEIDTQTAPIPSILVNNAIKNYVDANYKGTNIVKMDRDARQIEIKLNNQTELIFDLKGKFIRIDY